MNKKKLSQARAYWLVFVAASVVLGAVLGYIFPYPEVFNPKYFTIFAIIPGVGLVPVNAVGLLVLAYAACINYNNIEFGLHHSWRMMFYDERRSISFIRFLNRKDRVYYCYVSDRFFGTWWKSDHDTPKGEVKESPSFLISAPVIALFKMAILLVLAKESFMAIIALMKLY